MSLTPSGEVAVFVDDNQFASGQSVDKCGPEAVSVFWHSVRPGEKNPYSSADIHAMAHTDYEKFIGPDNPADHGGTSNQTLYNMLTAHGFKHEAGPNDMNWVKSWLAKGYPVIIGIVESSVSDGGISPYNWNTNGLTHIIVATGPGGAGEILVRDTANVDHNGIVRPGPRHYDSHKLQLISATMVVPSWMKDPSSPTPPPPPPPPPAPKTDYKKQAEDALKQLEDALSHLN